MRLLDITWIFIRRAGLVFGGAPNIGPSLEAELVDRRQVMARDNFWLSYGLSQMMPSIILANLAISLGRKLGGPFGSVAALIGLMVPSFIVAMTLTLLVLSNQQLDVVQAGMRTTLPAVIGVVAVAALKLARFHATRPDRIVLMAIIALGLIVGISPLVLIGAAGVAGAVLMRPTRES